MNTALTTVLLVALGGFAQLARVELSISSTNITNSEPSLLASVVAFFSSGIPAELINAEQQQLLAMLVIVALGIVGLLWIRQHTSEL